MPAVAKTRWHRRGQGKVSELEHNIFLKQIPPKGVIAADPLRKGFYTSRTSLKLNLSHLQGLCSWDNEEKSLPCEEAVTLNGLNNSLLFQPPSLLSFSFSPIWEGRILPVFSSRIIIILGVMANSKIDVTDVKPSILKVKYSCKLVTALERFLGLPHSVASNVKTK